MKGLGRAAAVSLLVAAVSIYAMPIMEEALGIPLVVDILEDRAFIAVSPDDSGIVYIHVDVRSPYTKNTEFRISASLQGVPTWGAEAPEMLYLESLEQTSFVVKVISPLGEDSGKSAVLTVTMATTDGISSWDDDCIIEVLPYTWASLEPSKDYLVDMPLEGRFDVLLSEEGNVDIPRRFELTFPPDSVIGAVEPVLCNMGDTATLSIPFTMDPGVDRHETGITASTNEWESAPLKVVFIREGGLVHILFGRWPVLILGPSLTNETGLSIRCIGGEVEDIGLEIVEGPGGGSIGMIGGMTLDDLDQREMIYRTDGFSESTRIMVRAYGYHDGDRVESNIWPLRIERDPAREGLDTGIIVTGGFVGAGCVLLGSAAYLYAASETWRYKALLLLFIPLYSVLKKEKVLDHFFRGRLFEYISEKPGVTFSELKKHFEVNNGVLTYHLHRLEKEELIAFKNIGKYKLFYADGVKMTDSEIVLSMFDKRILDMVEGEPGITATEIMDRLKAERAKRTVSRHIKDLQRKGLLEVYDDGGGRRLYLAENWSKRVFRLRTHEIPRIEY